MTAESDNAVLIKNSTKNEEHQEEGTSTKEGNGNDRLSYENLMKDYNIEMSKTRFDFPPFEETQTTQSLPRSKSTSSYVQFKF